VDYTATKVILASLRINLDNPLAKEVMTSYESMGDTLAFQYGGSAAHNKVIFLPYRVRFFFKIQMLVHVATYIGLYALWNVTCN
jgi:hypothetical protein